MKSGFSPFPVLGTDRLVLRRLELTDLHEIFFIRSEPEMNKFIERPKPASLREAEEFILGIQENIAEARSLYWAITLADHPKMIGTICLWNFSNQDTCAELGYELIPAYQGQGYLQEALRAVIQYGFSKILLRRMEAFTHKDNLRSIHLLKKNGFNQEWHLVDPDHPSNIIFSIVNPDFETL